MTNLNLFLSILKELQFQSTELQDKYDSISSILVLPSIKTLIENLKIFEQSGYLDHIIERNYEKLVAYTSQLLQELKASINQLEILLKSTKDYINDKHKQSTSALGFKSMKSKKTKLSNYFSFDPCLNIYEIFLLTNYTGTLALLYQNILNEKLKRKRLRINELKVEVEKAKTENGTRLLIEFLKRYDPYEKRLKIERPFKSSREIPLSTIRREVALGGRTMREHVISMIKRKINEIKNCNGKTLSRKHMFTYLDLTGYLFQLSQLDKRDALQKLCNDEFYIMKARKFVSVIFEDNREENERCIKRMEKLKRTNMNIRNEIDNLKKNIVARLNF